MKWFAPSRQIFIAIAVGGALLFSACPGPEYPKCEKDEHCKDKGEVCVFGQCQQCAKDDNCPGGKVCRNYRCVPRPECEGDAECTGGKVCRNGKCTLECVADADCGPGRSCQNNRCTTKTQCTEDNDCPEGQSCVRGHCQASAAAGGTGECELQRIGFDFNMSSINSMAQAVLDENARCLKQRSNLNITIEGHADERGTTEYNLALGERRADAAKKYLQKLGIDAARMKTISYGEERPLEASATEEAWAKNRRAEFVPR
ncbi:MAG: peptidoglycan-associated lipoprotein Pal [Deltaproteobacteria bacterium]|nr:peptidoglycan-associated lipoprotein Pal [Deltaproteobacteria bacterium]